MRNFEVAYKSLNVEQRRAVDHVDGPLLVIAGPGTGKTQLLSLRAAQILNKTDSSPSNILCLTYTNKATINMKERLVSLIGPEANHINVKTFHSFAGEVINQYPEYFWNSARLRPIPPTRQLEIIENILGSLPLSHPLALKFAGQFTLVGTVIESIGLAKEAGLSPAKLKSLIDLNIAYLDSIEDELTSLIPDRLTEKKYPELLENINNLKSMEINESIAPLMSLDQIIKESLARSIDEQLSGKKGAVSKWKSKWVQNVNGKKSMARERKLNEWWLNLSSVYEVYQTESQNLGFYDIPDMIIEVTKAIENHPDLRADLQERYTHVMIDEFQDTNLAQGRLSHLIAEHHTSEGRPNIMAVGDDDQTIYRFQGAELNNMRSFINLYSADTIVLHENYRSTQKILDASNKIIEQSDFRLVGMVEGLTKNLKANTSDNGNIENLIFSTRPQQYSEIMNIIKKHSTEGSVAVLARKHDSLKTLGNYFKESKIAVNYEYQENIFDNEIIKLVLKICGLVVSIHDGERDNSQALMADIIRHEIWGLDPMQLWGLAIDNHRSKRWIESILDHKDEDIANIGHWIMWLSTIADSEQASIVFEYIVGLNAGKIMRSPLLDYLKNQDVLLPHLSAINHFKRLVAEHGGKDITLKDFYTITKRLIENNKIISDTSSYVGVDNNVTLLTAHKAKGLEFDTVIIVDALDEYWSPNNRGQRRSSPSNLPLQKSGDDLDDYIRLLYVSMTRAKKNLYITSYQKNDYGDDVLSTPFLNEVIETKHIIKNKDENSVISSLATSMLWPRLDKANESVMLKTILSNYKLSATNLTTFLNVIDGGPKRFFEKHVLRIPTPGSEKMSFGSAMHEALEVSQKYMSNNAFDIASVQNAYEKSLYKEPMSLEAYERYLRHGHEVLNRLFTELEFQLDRNALPEQIIESTLGNGIKLTGKLDVIHCDNQKVWFDDYKTGKPVSSLTSKAKSTAVKTWRQRYQIIFYYILLMNSAQYNNKNIISGNMIYVESEYKKDLVRSYSPQEDEINRVEKLLNVVWNHIQSLDFPDTSNYEASFEGINQFCDDLIDGKI